MDWRLNLLLHCPLGLVLTPSELEFLARDPLTPDGPAFAADAVQNLKGRAYLANHPRWWEVSLNLLEQSVSRGVRWTYPYQPDYPRAWLSLSSRPAIVSYRGRPLWSEAAASGFLSVVGSRTPRPDTVLWLQREMTELLRVRDATIVSGGARGIDQWAHRLALDCGRRTVCIFPTGLLNPYPAQSEYLWRRILEQGGTLVSTFSLQQPLRKSLFAVRNRWIAGLSPATFVVEGNRRSGSLLTGRLAFDEHRTVCTLPTFPTAEQGLGNLDLLEQGALMIRDHRDLVTLYDRELGPTPFQRTEGHYEEDQINAP